MHAELKPQKFGIVTQGWHVTIGQGSIWKHKKGTTQSIKVLEVRAGEVIVLAIPSTIKRKISKNTLISQYNKISG